ncbi:MAG: YdiU family protein [Granulosicoccus sp.]
MNEHSNSLLAVKKIPSSEVIRRSENIHFDNSYARLPSVFYQKLSPTPVKNPQLLRLNTPLAEELELNAMQLQSDTGLAMLAGNKIPAGSEPLAMAYAGHQFGNWVPQLGDGRAVLLGEVMDIRGQRQDIQLKGAGRTTWSRGGDGRSSIGPVLREYIVSEAMAALGVPTTRALAAVATGEFVQRETRLPGGILTRIATSHIRVGTFQYFLARGDIESVRMLAGHVIDRHYPAARNAERPALALLDAVVKTQASLIAHWQSIGFIHGVMNTDNSSIAGITIDYGPCAFMDDYNSAKVFSSIDHGSRYAFCNQPSIAQWNMSNFAQCMLPLIDDDEQASIHHAQASIDAFPELYKEAYTQRMRDKLGLPDNKINDQDLASELLTLMETAGADFTLTFRALSTDVATARTYFENAAGFDEWLSHWQHRLVASNCTIESQQAMMQAANPYLIPRNHQIEAVIQAAIDDNDFDPFNRMVDVLAAPYIENTAYADLASPPGADEIVQQTFCGT